MRITVIGAGAIGTLLAYRFTRAGHEVTLVARGARLEELRRTRGVLRARERRGLGVATVAIASGLDLDAGEDLLLVTVRRQHADALLEEIVRSRARRIMFAFNTAGGLARFRDAVGVARFAWGFPAAIARLDDGVLVYRIVPGWLRALQITMIGGASVEALAALFVATGFPTRTSGDLEPWLATHAAVMAPMIASGVLASAGRLARADAALVAAALRDGLERVGARATPMGPRVLRRLPTGVIAFALRCAFGFTRVRASVGGAHAGDEALAMLDDLDALPGGEAIGRLRAVLERSRPSPHRGSPDVLTVNERTTLPGSG